MKEEILNKLRAPFHPSDVTWKPGPLTKDKERALSHPHVSIRAYHNRLDEVCGMNWSVTYTPWEERIVCHITINGVTRSSSGENNEFDNAECTAFKRACAMFGLGRYLLGLPQVWVEYDAEQKRYTDRALAKLEGIIVQHYRRTMAETQL